MLNHFSSSVVQSSLIKPAKCRTTNLMDWSTYYVSWDELSERCTRKGQTRETDSVFALSPACEWPPGSSQDHNGLRMVEVKDAAVWPLVSACFGTPGGLASHSGIVTNQQLRKDNSM